MVFVVAEMCFVEDDQETVNAKRDLYIQDDRGQWVANQEILHRAMSNNLWLTIRNQHLNLYIKDLM